MCKAKIRIEGKHIKTYTTSYARLEHINTQDLFSIALIVPHRGGAEKMKDNLRVSRWGLLICNHCKGIIGVN